MSSTVIHDEVNSALPKAARWINANAVPLKGVSAGIGFDDLTSLKDWIGDARVVGLGEATHSTREFFQLKHRMLEFLVTELGFTLFILEDNLSESLAVNRYVLTGEGDPKVALTGMRFWCYDTEEVLDLIEWMRGWNEKHDRKVFFYGFDMQSSATAAICVLDYLQRNEQATYNRIRDALLPLAIDVDANDWLTRSELHWERAREAIAQVISVLESKEAHTAEQRYELGIMRLHANVLQQRERQQYWQIHGEGYEKSWGARDRYMADNIIALLALHGASAKAVVWAHNGHVTLNNGETVGVPPMGQLLREEFGEGYRVFGFLFDQGSFGAEDETGRIRGYTVPPHPAEALPAVLAATGHSQLALDLRSVSCEVQQWLATGPAWRNIPGTYHAGLEGASWTRSNVQSRFDALLFVRDTSAAHRLANVLQPACDEPPASGGFVNLDFSAVSEGRPCGWRVSSQLPHNSYKVSVVSAAQRVLEISRSGSPSLWSSCVLSQTVSAVPWQGKRVTFRCPVSVQVVSHSGSAQLAVRMWERQDRPENVAEHVALWLARHRWQRVSSREAQSRELSLTVEVSDTVTVLEFSLVMTGDGRAQFGTVTVTSEE